MRRRRAAAQSTHFIIPHHHHHHHHHRLLVGLGGLTVGRRRRRRPTHPRDQVGRSMINSIDRLVLLGHADARTARHTYISPHQNGAFFFPSSSAFPRGPGAEALARGRGERAESKESLDSQARWIGACLLREYNCRPVCVGPGPTRAGSGDQSTSGLSVGSDSLAVASERAPLSAPAPRGGEATLE
jgi:hypothetical protein